MAQSNHMPKIRDIESLLKQIQTPSDPRFISLICTVAERLRIQHDQMMLFATEFGRMQDLLLQLIEKMGIRDANLKKLGVEEMLKGSMSDQVSAVDIQDDDARNTHDISRKN